MNESGSGQSTATFAPRVVRGHRFSVMDYDHLVICQICRRPIFGSTFRCDEIRHARNVNGHLDLGGQVQSRCAAAAGWPQGQPQIRPQPQPQTVRFQASAPAHHRPVTQIRPPPTVPIKTGCIGGVSALRQRINMSAQPNIPSASPGTTQSEIDIIFITERILVLTYPSHGSEESYKRSLRQVCDMLKDKHNNRYKILNMSKRRKDLRELNERVSEFGWPEELAPPLERLCAICREIEQWLAEHKQNVLVVHSKGGRSRPAVVIAAYMHYTNICASDDQALDRFAMRRFSDDYVGAIAQPSHKRYVTYFASLLNGSTKVNSSPIYLQHINIVALPNTSEHDASQTCLKIYEKMQPVWTSAAYSSKQHTLSVSLSKALSLRGDVLLKCFDRSSRVSRKRLLFRCQFNTCALRIEENGLTRIAFDGAELDDTALGSFLWPGAKPSRTHPQKDQKYPNCTQGHDPVNTRLELYFSVDPLCAQDTPVTPPSPQEHDQPLQRTDSYEDFDSFVEDAGISPLSEDRELPTKPLYNGNGIGNGHVHIMQIVEPSDSESCEQPHNPEPEPVETRQLYASIQRPNESTDSGICIGGTNHTHIQCTTTSTPATADMPREPHITQKNLRRADKNDVSRQLERVFGAEQEAQAASIQQHNNTAQEPYDRMHPKAAPPVAPKPRRSSSDSNSGTPNRAPAHLPHSLRRPESPVLEPPSAQIDVGLIGADRYDQSSHAFSYVPLGALKDHFLSPRKQTRLVQRVEDSLGRDVSGSRTLYSGHESPMVTVERDQSMDREGSRSRGDSHSRQDRYRDDQPNRGALDEPRSHLDDVYVPDEQLSEQLMYKQLLYERQSQSNQPINHQSIPTNQHPAQQSHTNSQYPNSTNTSLVSSPVPNHKPTAAPRKNSKTKNYKDYRVLDDYESDMDEMCDPDFYMTFDRTKETPSVRHESHYAPISKQQAPSRTDVQMRQHHRDPQQARATSSLSHLPPDHGYHNHNANYAHSVSGTPIMSRQQARAPQDSSSCSLNMDPDEWLESQLQRLRMFKESRDPDHRRRKQTERLLIEELKNVNDDRLPERSRLETGYTYESTAPNSNTNNSNINSNINSNSNSNSVPHVHYDTDHKTPHNNKDQVRSPLSSRQHPLPRPQHLVTGKPPTPPPKERSQTPPSSPRRMSPVQRRGRRTPPLEMLNQVAPPPSYQQHHNSYGVQSPSSAHDFNLESIIYENQNIVNGQQLRHTAPSPKSILKKPRFAVPQSPVNNANANGTVAEPVISHEQASYKARQQHPSYNPTPIYNHQTEPASVPSTPRTPAHDYVQQYTELNTRSDTPQFPPVRQGEPVQEQSVGSHPLLYEQEDSALARQHIVDYHRPTSVRSPSPGSMYYGHSRRSSITSLSEPMEVIHHHPVFVKDTSKFWYKPKITREEAINILRDKQPGSFIVRDSNSFPGAFGLAMKVSTPPPGVQAKSDGTELVRHFLIEPSNKGVKLKGCNNEPVFGSLSALVYQHSTTPLALPCKLQLPEYDLVHGPEHTNAAVALLEQGAACNVTYMFTCDCESLTGPEAVRRSIDKAFLLHEQKELIPVSVHFKVSAQGITITDNTRKLFFRRHYATNTVTFCGLDPEDRRWSPQSPAVPTSMNDARMFAFVARKTASRSDNVCHVFAELEPEQPATAVVNFVTKVLMGGAR